MENYKNSFVVDKKSHKFQIYIEGKLASESYYSIEGSYETFNEKYLGLFKLKTLDEFRRKGISKQLLSLIFQYAKTTLNINFILLNVFVNNTIAVNLYIKSGFEILGEYDDDGRAYYTLIKKLDF